MINPKISFIKGKQQEYVDLSVIKKELGELIQIDNLNFFIGSGCSSWVIDDDEKAIPVMAKLYKQFFDENKGFTIAGVEVEKRFKDLEKLLDFMNSTKMVNEIKMVDEQIINKINKVQEFIRRKVQAGLNNDDLLKVYKDFYLKIIKQSRKNPINIFTTNYDLYNEKALDELGFMYNNGFSGSYLRRFNPNSFNYTYVENMNLNKDIWTKVPNFYNLYKIHGSISWVNKNNHIYEQNYKTIKEDEVVMIYPTPLKDRTTLMTPYSDLLRNMQDALLKNNSVLIVMGYSFSDEHINRIILNALSVPTFKLIVFGFSENINKLKEIEDKRIIIINSVDNIQYFKRIVSEILPNVLDDIEENVQKVNASKALETFEKSIKNEQ